MKTLSKRWSDFLRTQAETGMGYQVVSVTLCDGRTIEDIAIIAGNIIGEVRGCSDVPFEPNDIVSVVLTHNRWQFKR